MRISDFTFSFRESRTCFLLFIVFINIFISCKKENSSPAYVLSATSSPNEGGKIDIQPQSVKYKKGDAVTITATPNEHWVFQKWEGDVSSTTNPLELNINSNVSIVGLFVKRDYPLKISIEGEGAVEEKIVSDQAEKNYTYGTKVELTPKPKEGWKFYSWGGDLSGNEIPKTITVDKAKNISAIFVKKVIADFEILNLKDQYSITDLLSFKLKPIYDDGSQGSIVDDLFTFEILSGKNNVSNITKNGFVFAKSGNLKIEFDYLSKKKTFEIKILPYKIEEIDVFLKTPVANHKKLIPVVIINYLPTTDGINVDQKYYPIRDYADKIVQDCKISEVKKWSLNNDIKTKFAIEEGSKFRGYNSPTAIPYIGVQVIKHVTFYEVDKVFNPQSIDEEEGYFPNYESIFNAINLKNLVENQGVKEVWFNSKSLSVPESNMSSPTSGDISNSSRTKDLPVYNKTYVVYGNFIHRWYAENIHNRGHQIEAQLAYLDFNFGGAKQNNSLFWNDFVGFKRDGSSFSREGRVGSTHFTPNSTRDYDYDNTTPINSDITDWTPNNSGLKTVVKNTTWKNEIKFNATLPEVSQIQRFKDNSGKATVGGDPQGGWLIYWFQSIPGYNSKIPYNSGYINNWWDLFYDWDEAVRSKKKLWQ